MPVPLCLLTSIPFCMHRTGPKHRKVLSTATSGLPSGLPSRHGSLSPCNNSYLVETPRLTSLGEDIRREIERRFRHSRVNATYVFPRTTKETAAPLPPSGAVAGLGKGLLKAKSSKSINSSLNSSFARLNDSQVSLNVSRNRTPTHSRNPSLTKLLTKTLLGSRPRLIRLANSPYVKAPTISRPATRAVKSKKPLRTPLSQSFLTHERPY